MAETLKFHYEAIACPNCAHKQIAKVTHTEPFYTYIHECVKCKYVATESDWIRVVLTKSIKFRR